MRTPRTVSATAEMEKKIRIMVEKKKHLLWREKVVGVNVVGMAYLVEVSGASSRFYPEIRGLSHCPSRSCERPIQAWSWLECGARVPECRDLFFTHVSFAGCPTPVALLFERQGGHTICPGCAI